MTGVPLRIIPNPDIDGPSGVDLQPGDMWRDNECWAVVLPNRTVWYSGIAAADGSYWTVTGEAPNLTVHPSINDTDPAAPWHGWITDGMLKRVPA